LLAEFHIFIENISPEQQFPHGFYAEALIESIADICATKLTPNLKAAMKHTTNG
jgi:hypothetical protein